MWRFLLLLAVVVVLSAVDLIATIVCLESGGFIELNPVGSRVYASGGTPGLCVFKAGMVAASLGLTGLVARRDLNLAMWSMKALALISLAMAIWWALYLLGL